MTKQSLRSFLSLLFVLCFSAIARGQTLKLTGDTTVCMNTTASYTASVGLTSYSQIDWYITKGDPALIPTPPQSGRTILWGAPGMGTIIVNGWDTVIIAGDTSIVIVKRDTLNVTILPTPAPIIESDVQQACQPMDQPIQNQLSKFDDTGCIKVCAFNTITYKVKGMANSTYDWSGTLGGDVLSSAGDSAVIIWGSTGFGKITVQETSADGCVGTVSKCVEIVESPIAHFVAMPDTAFRTINICKETEVVFIDYSKFSSGSPIVAWRWDFGDGTYSNEKSDPSAPISHTYNTAGLYTVSLTVTNQCGCSTTETMLVSVSNVKGVEISCPGLVCENASYGYTAMATCPGGAWQVVGGTIQSQNARNLQVKWDNVGATGFGYVIYRPGSCSGGVCPLPVSIKIPVVKAVGTITGPTHLCVSQQYMYKLPQWPSTVYNWSVNNPNVTVKATDQPNEIVLIPNTTIPGTVTLTCNYNNTLLGCTGTATKTIFVRPQMTITGLTQMCEGGEFSYQLNGLNANTGKWKLIDPHNNVTTGGPNASFAAVFDDPGTYILSATGDFCPPEPLEIKVLATPAQPDSIVGPARICRGVPTEYVAGYIDGAHIFTWSVTNGTVNMASGETSDITLNTGSTGPFTISVIRVTKEAPHCQSIAKTKTISLPNPIFSVTGTTSVCPSEAYSYSVNYLEGEAYDWSIYPQDKGSVMEPLNPLSPSDGQSTREIRILWNKAPGDAKVICRVRKCDVYTYDTLDVHIKSLDVHITALPDSACLYEYVMAQMDEAGGGITWNTGAEKLPGGADIEFRYRKPITTYTKYYVTGTVNQPYGCNTPQTAKDSIIVVPAPYAILTPRHYSYCDNPAISALFTASYDPLYPAPVSYQWSHSGVIVGSGTTYTANDTGQIYLHAAGPYGCPSQHEASVWNDRGCDTFAPGVHGTCPSAWITLATDDSITCDSAFIKVKHSNNLFHYAEWENATAKNDSTGVFVRGEAGVYTVIYRAYYYNTVPGQPDCMEFATITITVPYSPKLEVTQTCTFVGGQRLVNVKDLSTSIYPLTTRLLEVGVIKVDSNKDEYNVLVDTNFQYHHTRNIRLYHWGPQIAAGSWCTADTQMHIDGKPRAAFTFDRPTTCAVDAAVKFTNHSRPMSNRAFSLWDFGDVSQNQEQHPERVYSAPGPSNGNYDVKLLFTDPWGCKDSVTKQVPIISEDVRGNADITPRYPCQYDIATGTYVPDPGTRTPGFYEWFDMFKNKWYNGVPFHPTRSGGYYIHVEDMYGCYDDTPYDTVTFIRAPRAVIYGDTATCRDKNFTLSAYVGTIPGLTYEWERNDTVISGATTSDLLQNLRPGRYKFNATTTTPNPHGGFCSNRSDDFYVTINDTPIAPVIQVSIINCNDYTVRLRVMNEDTNFIYNWNNGKVGTPADMKHGGHFEVIVTDNKGCMNKAQVHTLKDPREYLWIFPSGCYSLCYTRQNIISGPIISFTQWNYKKGAGTIAGASPGTVTPLNLNPHGVGVYTMFLRNGTCSATSKPMTVDFNCKPGGPGAGLREEYNEVGSLGAAASEMYLAPNPAANSTRVTYSYLGNAACNLQVYDMVGKLVYSTPLYGNSGVFDIDLSNFTPGIYKVALRQNNMLLQQATLSITR